jgi:23S rRNA (pseudouridine1915-N3)-methyltransferase
LRISVVAVGKLREPSVRAVADEYVRRLRRYVRVEEIEVKEEGGLERSIPGESTLVALEVWGKGLTSEEFAQRVEGWGRTGKGQVAFLIGGAEGIPRHLSQQAAFHMSLSTMTLPHRLARIVLFEQIYRAMTILRGEPYAREG